MGRDRGAECEKPAEPSAWVDGRGRMARRHRARTRLVSHSPATCGPATASIWGPWQPVVGLGTHVVLDLFLKVSATPASTGSGKRVSADSCASATSTPSPGIICRVSVALTSRRGLLALATSPGWERAVRAVPGGEWGAYRLAKGYVAGTRPDQALACAHRLAAAGLASSIDFFGDNVSDPVEADRVTDHYVALAERLERAPENTFLSIDLSHIGLDQPNAVQQRLERIASALPANRRVQVGAEQERRADRILAAVAAVARRGGAVSGTIQANLKRSRADGQALAESGVPIRLVKGAYAEDAQVARPWGEPTDLAFIELAHELHANGAEVAIATHDAVLR
jgi:proline dehydrogenase